MLLRWAASFLLPTGGPWAGIAAAAAAHTIAVHSRCAMAAGCADSACRCQKRQAMLLVHLMQLAYWLPMVWACCTIGAALWSTAWHGALLLQGPALRALTFYVLSCEHWWLRWELEWLAFRSESSEVTAAHRQLLQASRLVAADFGRWPLLIVRNLIASLGSQRMARPAYPSHGTMAFATAYVAAQCAAFTSQDPATLIDETKVLRHLRWLTQPHSIASTSLHHLLPPARLLVYECLVCIFDALCLALNVEAAFQQTATAPRCQMLYLTDAPPQQAVLSQAAGAAASTLVALLRRAALPQLWRTVLPLLRRSALAICRRALAMVTVVSKRTVWRQAGHAFALALSYEAVDDACTSGPVLWHQEALPLCCCLFGVANHFEALPAGLDLAFLQALTGGMLLARSLAGCFGGHEMAVWSVALCTVGLVLHAGWKHRSRASNPGATAGAPRTHVQLAARALYSLLFTWVTARTAYLTARAALAAGGLRHVPGALLSPAALPHTLLLAVSLEVWAWQAMQDGVGLIDGREEVAAGIATAAPLRAATWWPLEACRGLLQLAVAALSGQAGRVVAVGPPYRVPLGVRILQHGPRFASLPDATAMFRKASTEFHANCAWLLLEFPLLSIMVAATVPCALHHLFLWLASTAAFWVHWLRLWQAGMGEGSGAAGGSQGRAAVEAPQPPQRGTQLQPAGAAASPAGLGPAPAIPRGATSQPAIFSAGGAGGVAQTPLNRRQRRRQQQQGAAAVGRQPELPVAASSEQAAPDATPSTAPALARTIGDAVHVLAQLEGTAASPLDSPAGPAEQPRKRCANCGATSGGSVKLKKCGGCRRVRYCSAECQAAQWEQHRLVCARFE